MTTKQSIILPISVTKLKNLKSLIQLVPLGQSLGLNLDKSWELIKQKQCQQVSRCIGCGTSFHKTDKKLNILGRNELERYETVTTTNKQYNIGQRNTFYCSKERYLVVNIGTIWCTFQPRPQKNKKKITMRKFLIFFQKFFFRYFRWNSADQSPTNLLYFSKKKIFFWGF